MTPKISLIFLRAEIREKREKDEERYKQTLLDCRNTFETRRNSKKPSKQKQRIRRRRWSRSVKMLDDSFCIYFGVGE